MEKTHQLPISLMIKERRLRWLGQCRSDNNMVKQLLFATRIPGHVQPVGRPCGTWMHYAMRDVKDMGQQMGYRSLGHGSSTSSTSSKVLQESLPIPPTLIRMELAKRSHEQTYLGWYC